MSKYLITFLVTLTKSSDITINTEIRSVSDMFSYYIQKAKILANGIGKIMILFSNKNNIELLPEGILICNLIPQNIYKISQDFDINKNRELYAKDIYLSIEYICKNQNIDMRPFNEIFKNIKSKNYIFEEYWKTNKWNRSRTYKAYIKWNYEDYIYLYVEIFNKKINNNFFIFISKIEIGLGVLASVLGKLVWQNEKTLLLFHLNKRDYWIIDIETKKVTFVFPRAESGDPHGQFDLGKMYYNGSTFLDKNEALGLSWIKKSADQGFKSAIKFLEKIK